MITLGFDLHVLVVHLYFCHCHILENCKLFKKGEHGEINEKELQGLSSQQKNQAKLPPLVYLNLNDTDVQQSNHIIHPSNNSRNNSSPVSTKNMSVQQQQQQTTSSSVSLNQQPTELFYENASKPQFDRNSSVPPISIPSVNSSNINSSSNNSHQGNNSVASSYEEGKDLDEQITSCSTSRRGSSPAVVCTPPTVRRSNYNKAGSAPKSTFAMNHATSQVGKMSPLARYGSLKRVYNKEQERLNPNNTSNLLLQNPDPMIHRSLSHTAISQHQDDQEDEYEEDFDSDDEDSCYCPHCQGHAPILKNGEQQQRSRLRTKPKPRRRHLDSLEVPSDYSGGSGKESTPPGVPVPTPPRRNSAQLRSRSMMNVAEMAVACAADVVGKPLLNVNQARSRSYLLGSCGPTSLLGAEELERYFPDRSIRVFVGTWNMNGQTPPRHLSDFLLPERIDFVPDVLVIGSQESFPERTEWEIRLQDTLGPSHVLYHSAVLGTLHIAIFLRRDLIWFCSVPDVDSFSTRPGAQFKTKGAVAVGFILFGTSFLFVNAHLTAHQENTRDRIKDLKKLNAVLNLPKILQTSKGKHKNRVSQFSKSRDFTDNFDAVFWCGDLNFRLEQTRPVVEREVAQKANSTDGNGGSNFTSVLDFDQLNYLRSEGLIFKGYKEDPIHFPPTFKYDPGTNEFDTSSKQRVPSYTDRILYKSRRTTGHNEKKQKIKSLHYDCVRDVVTSDHKPVWGMWEVAIRPGRDNSVPLSGGLFNREVYLEGLKRRSEALQPPGFGNYGKTGDLCVLQ